MRTTVLSLLAASTLLACTKPSEDAAPSAKASGSSAKPAASAPATTVVSGLEVKVPALGLKGNAPGETAQPSASETPGSQLLMFAQFSVGLYKEDPAIPKTAELLKETATLRFDDAGNFKLETLPDGFALTYEKADAKSRGFVASVVRRIDGQRIECEATADSDAQRQKGILFCKSLTKG